MTHEVPHRVEPPSVDGLRVPCGVAEPREERTRRAAIALEFCRGDRRIESDGCDLVRARPCIDRTRAARIRMRSGHCAQQRRAPRVHDDRPCGDHSMHRTRCVELRELVEVRRVDESEAGHAKRHLPPLADERAARAQLAGGTREREGLEAARDLVAHEHESRLAPRAGPHGALNSLSGAGSDSTSAFRSSERSTVVTSVTPSRTTTTRFSTP